MTNYKYQEKFALELSEQWLNGNREHVRLTIRGLKNKAQAAFIAAMVTIYLTNENHVDAVTFANFIHPNYR